MDADEMKCPQCAEIIKKAAKVCKHCGHDLSGNAKKSDTKQTAQGCGILAVLGLVGVLLVSTCSGSEEERAAEEAKAADDRQKGFHCLSAWDGSHREVVNQVKAQLRDPSSFEHTETRISPVDEDGNHQLRMTYRARNGFGGMNVGQAVAAVRQSDCEATVITAGAD